MLVDHEGKVQALWSSFPLEGGRAAARPTAAWPSTWCRRCSITCAPNTPLHTLDAEFSPLPLTEARRQGLPDAWVAKLTTQNPERRQVLTVARITGGAASGRILRQGDLVLAVEGKPVTTFRDVERAVADRPTVALTVLRGQKEQALQVPTTELTGSDIDRIVLWAGAVLHAPHRAMSAQRGVVPQGVYVAFFNYGSPATRYRLNRGAASSRWMASPRRIWMHS